MTLMEFYNYHLNTDTTTLYIYENEFILAEISQVNNIIQAEELFKNVVYELRGIEL